MPPVSTIQVLVSPLDWGLGHATRCIPIIKTLTAHGLTVILASGGPQMTLLKDEFPGLEMVEIPGYGIRYSSKKGGWSGALYFGFRASCGRSAGKMPGSKTSAETGRSTPLYRITAMGFIIRKYSACSSRISCLFKPEWETG